MKKLSLILISIVLFANIASAEQITKIATIDVNAVMNNLEEAKSKKENLDSETNKAKNKIEIKRKVLKEKELKLQAKGITADSEEAAEYRKEVREFERMVKDTETELKTKFLKVNKELTDRVLKNVEEYAKANKIQLVLDSSNRRGSSILYNARAYDITKDVIKQLNK